MYRFVDDVRAALLAARNKRLHSSVFVCLYYYFLWDRFIRVRCVWRRSYVCRVERLARMRECLFEYIFMIVDFEASVEHVFYWIWIHTAQFAGMGVWRRQASNY